MDTLEVSESIHLQEFKDLKKIKDMLIIYPDLLLENGEISKEEAAKFIKALDLVEKNYVQKNPQRAKELIVIYFNMMGILTIGSAFPSPQEIEDYKKGGEKLTRTNFIRAKQYFGSEIKKMEQEIRGANGKSI